MSNVGVGFRTKPTVFNAVCDQYCVQKLLLLFCKYIDFEKLPIYSYVAIKLC